MNKFLLSVEQGYSLLYRANEELSKWSGWKRRHALFESGLSVFNSSRQQDTTASTTFFRRNIRKNSQV